MLRGFRDKFLQSVSNRADETQICNILRDRFSPAWQETLRWQSFWQVILRLFYPDLDNVNFGTSAGEIKMGRVYSSDPANFLTTRVDFIQQHIFPRDGMWYRMQPYSPKGELVERGAVSVAEQRYMDEIAMLSRHLVLKSGFYDVIGTSLIHHMLLGEAYNYLTIAKKEMRIVDLPVHRLGVLKDSTGLARGLGYYQSMDDWEVVREYGKGALRLFEKTTVGNPRPQGNMPFGSQLGNHRGFAGAITPAAGVYTIGTSDGMTNKGDRLKHTLRITVPNNEYMGIPNGGLMEGMQYVTFVVAEPTNRLVDVEFHPEVPYGAISDKRVSGEYFARSLGSRLLPDVGVLNQKKKSELIADALTARSPIVVAGKGFVRPIGNRIFPHQILHAHQGTEVNNLYDRTQMMRRNKSAVEDERLSLGEGMQIDKMQMEPKSHVAGGTYTQYQDANFSLFAPQALMLQEKLGISMVEAIINGGVLTGQLPTPPAEMLESEYTYKLVPYSVFSFGQEGQKGQNLLRAFQPISEFIPQMPELLDYFNAGKFLKSNLSRYELSHYINSPEEAHRVAQARMAMRAGAEGQQQLSPEDEARNRKTQQVTEGQLTEFDVGQYTGA